jgi:hypothetical protein
MKERGQGLVEMALILPFLLVLVVGIVELGIALNRQIVVVNAAREAARFAAQGARSDDIYAQVFSAASQLPWFDGDSVAVAVVRAQTDEDGGDFTEWEVYPEGAAVLHVTPEKVLEELQQAGGDTADLKLVIVDIEYDHKALLGFPFVSALADRIPIGSWSAMRLETLEPVGAKKLGCSAYPIAVHKDTLIGKEGQHVGDIYNGASSGAFGWLRWPEHASYASATWLRNFLNDPAWSRGNPKPDEYPDYPGFQNADDDEDHELNVGDSAWGNTGLSNSQENQAALDSLADGKRIRVVVWDSASGSGDWVKYHIYGFAIVEITCDGAPPASECATTGKPYSLTGTNRISARFIGWDTICD